MKSTLRTLTLLSVCSLFHACGDEQPLPAQKPKAPVEARPRARERRKVELPMLTAAAPSTPRSILDTPTPAPMAGLASTRDAGSMRGKAQEKALDKSPPGGIAKDVKDPKDELLGLDCEPSAGSVNLARFVLATGVADREPTGETDMFSTESEKIWAFAEFENEHGAPFSVKVHWEKLDGPATPYGVVLDVPTAKRFRTWSWTAIRRTPGQYRAVLRTLDGEELASRTFEIKASGALER